MPLIEERTGAKPKLNNMKTLNVRDHKKFCHFEYESTTCSTHKLGDVVKKNGEIGVIIQIHGDGEYRTDTWGNCSINEIESATITDVVLLPFGEKILPELKRACKYFKADNTPRYLRIYDNEGATFDKYTAVFTRKVNKEFIYLGISSNARGFCQHGFSPEVIDRPKYSHLGKRVNFADLSTNCKRAILESYESIYCL